MPQQNSTYKLVPSLTIQGITSADFDLAWGEAQNINTPSNTVSGLVITGTKQWKAADVNENGVLDLIIRAKQNIEFCKFCARQQQFCQIKFLPS